MRNLITTGLKFFIIIVALFLVLPGFGVISLHGLNPAIDISQYNLDVYTTAEGLPQSSILTIIQTLDGYLWMGTYEGIARFDGIRFTVFDSTNTPQMMGNRVKALLEDQNRNLWIGTSGGLLRYSNGNFTNIAFKEAGTKNFVISLCQDQSGKIWVGTTQGLYLVKKETVRPFPMPLNTPSQYISSLAHDHSGKLWIGTSRGLYSLNNSTISRSMLKGLPENVDVRTLYLDSKGCLWVGTGGNGLAMLKQDEFKLFTSKDGLSGMDIRAIFSDSSGALWIGTNGQGLNVYRNQIFSSLTSSEGLFNQPIRSITEDREGSLWIGTRSGLTQLKEGKFAVYNKRNGLPTDSVRTVFQDNENNIWLGMLNSGLVRMKDKQLTTFGFKEGLKSLRIWTIHQSRDATSAGNNSLWVGTYGGGLYQLIKNRIKKVYDTSNGLSNNIVRAVYADVNEQIWVGTNGGGLDVINPANGEIKHYTTKNGLSDNFIYAINGDNNGNIWIGTYYGNLNRFKKDKFTVFGQKHGLHGQAIWSIYPDKDDAGKIWLGTDGAGLLLFNNGTITRFTSKDGLYSDQAFQVLEDKRGNIWMNCNKGIYWVKKGQLDDYRKGKIMRIPCGSFGKREGIKNTECAGPAQPAGLCAADGKLWFPTIKGAVVIDPENIKTNPVSPLLAIEEVRVDGKTIPMEPPLTLSAGRKRVEFKYTGLSFVNSRQVKFKFKLEGFDEDWVDAGSRRSVSYTNIEPGNYIFRVMACNNDGVWNKKSTNISITLQPFFWQTWWFQVLVLIAFAVLSYFLISFARTHIKLISFWEKKKCIASYEIDEAIGSGGMGIVYKVHSLMDKSKSYAVKVLREEFRLDELQKKRFKNESILVDRIDHPNIVKVYERGEDDGNLYIVMELLNGQTLAQRFIDNQYPTIRQAINILVQVAHILVKLHREDIIHRDLKPENIMLIQQDEDPNFVKLLDFGLAREQHVPHLTETGQVLGTIAYMPPEVVHRGKFSLAVDIYSLGIIGYQMLVHKKPFIGEKLMDTMMSILTHEPTEPILVNPDVPPQLNRLLQDMMAKDPAHRPDARAVLTTLASLLPPRT